MDTIIPLTNYVNETFELEEETFQKIEILAKKHNATSDEIINEILCYAVSTQLEHETRNDWLPSTYEKISVVYIDGKPVAKLIPIRS